MFWIEVERPVPWMQFKEMIAYGVVEQKTYGECTGTPHPDKDDIVASVLVIWTESLITTMNVAEKEDWPIAPLEGYSVLCPGNSIGTI
jgi:hypothetical protein